jgi:PAS domain-containing protein
MTNNDNSDLIELCYAAVDEVEGYQVLIEMLSQKIGADAGDIVLESTAHDSCLTLGTLGFDPVFLENYDTEYLGNNTWFEELKKLAPNRSYTDEVFSEKLGKSAYFNEWVKPQGLEHSIGAVLESQMDSNGWIGLTRCTGGSQFSDKESAVIDNVVPHLKRSVTLLKSVNVNDGKMKVLSVAVGGLALPIVVLDNHGRIVEMNPKAEEFFSENSLLKISTSGHILTRCGKTHAKIGAAIHKALTMLDEPHALPPAPVIVSGHRQEDACSFEAAHYRGSDGLSGVIVIIRPVGKL